MPLSKLFSYKHFTGMNTVEKEFRLPSVRNSQYQTLTDMLLIENMDIDNSLTLTTRSGSSQILSGSNVHSLWSNGDVCLFVDGSTLYSFDGTISSEIGEIGTGRVSYIQWNDKIYLTNGLYIGYYDGSLNALSNPDVNYKVPLPAGRFVTYYRGRLYVAKGNVIYISDALCEHYDVRTGFRVLEGDITMLVAVEEGLYVSDGKTWWIQGGEPEEFQRVKVLEYDAIPYTAVVVDGTSLSENTGSYVIWTSERGICVGSGKGEVKNVTSARYVMGSHGRGGAVIRNVNEVEHYITTLE